MLIGAFLEAAAAGKKLVVDLDGTSIYGIWFLEQVFGGMVRYFKSRWLIYNYQDILIFKSQEEPYIAILVQEIIKRAIASPRVIDYNRNHLKKLFRHAMPSKLIDYASQFDTFVEAINYCEDIELLQTSLMLRSEDQFVRLALDFVRNTPTLRGTVLNLIPDEYVLDALDEAEKYLHREISREKLTHLFPGMVVSCANARSEYGQPFATYAASNIVRSIALVGSSNILSQLCIRRAHLAVTYAAAASRAVSLFGHYVGDEYQRIAIKSLDWSFVDEEGT